MAIGKDKIRITAVIPQDLASRADLLAERMGLSRSQFLTYALKQVVDAESIRETLPALLEAFQKASSSVTGARELRSDE